MPDYLMRSQAPLAGEEWQTLDATVVQVARRNLVGRRFLTIAGPVSAAVQSYAADTFPAPSPAKISQLANDEEGLVTVQSRRFPPLPILYRDFGLHWRDLETSRRLGIPLETTGAAIAAAAVADMEDRLIFNGYDELQQAGLLNAAGRQQLPLGDWGKVGGGFAAVSNAIRALADASFQRPYTVAVPPQLYILLNRVYNNTAVLEVDQIRTAVEGGVYMTPALPNNLAVVVAPGQENMDLLIAQDMAAAFLETTAMDHHLRVLEILSPRIKRPGAVCVLGQT